MKKVLNNIVHSSIAKGFDGWTRYISIMNEQEDHMEVVIKRLTNGRLTAGFRAWTFNVATMKLQETLLIKVISRIFKVQIWKGFGKWKSNIAAADKLDAELRTKRRLMKKILCKITNGKVMKLIHHYQTYWHHLFTLSAIIINA